LAKEEARRISAATANANSATQTALQIEAARPSNFNIAMREAGRRLSEKAPIIGGGLAAAGTALSVDEAVKRYKQGDYSGMVLYTLEGALNTMAMAPPTSPRNLAIKGVGAVGSFGMIPIGIAHDYFKGEGPWKKNPPQKARGGLMFMR
jgi:hypothetical protein